MDSFSTFDKFEHVGEKAGKVIRSKGFKLVGLICLILGVVAFGWVVFLKSMFYGIRNKKPSYLD